MSHLGIFNCYIQENCTYEYPRSGIHCIQEVISSCSGRLHCNSCICMSTAAVLGFCYTNYQIRQMKSSLAIQLSFEQGTEHRSFQCRAYIPCPMSAWGGSTKLSILPQKLHAHRHAIQLQAPTIKGYVRLSQDCVCKTRRDLLIICPLPTANPFIFLDDCFDRVRSHGR